MAALVEGVVHRFSLELRAALVALRRGQQLRFLAGCGLEVALEGLLHVAVLLLTQHREVLQVL